jgi:hypothetical protein
MTTVTRNIFVAIAFVYLSCCCEYSSLDDNVQRRSSRTGGVDAFTVSSTSATIQVNQKLPMVDLHFGFPPQLINSALYASNKNLLILCLPGAFTPTYVPFWALKCVHLIFYL